MSKLNIILDSSILKKERKLTSTKLKLLNKLSHLSIISLHFPWVVYKEYTTSNITNISEDINKLLKSIRLIMGLGLDETEKSSFKEILENILNIKKIIPQSVDKHWKGFIEESKATVCELEDSHGKNVMSSYFEGLKPFSSKKNRNDIPDAFIYESILTIVNKIKDNVVFVCNDNNLRKSITGIAGIVTFNSLEEFYESNEYKNIDKEYKKIEHYADELIELEKNLNIVEEIIENGVEDFLCSMVGTDVESDKIPSDNNDGTFVNLEKIYSSEIIKDDIIFINDLFYLKVLVKGSARIEYFLYKWDEHQIENRKNADIIDDDWNDHYYEVGESYDFELTFDCYINKDNVNKIRELYDNGDLDFLVIDEGSASFENLEIT